MERVILHSDMNCFYASVETMLNPALRDLPVAVCGSTEDRHGIVLAKSEKAKKAGVKTGMVNWEAQRVCPGLIMVPPQYDQYLKFSKLAHQIYYRYTDLVEPFGMDECWLDVSSICKTVESGKELADEIRQTIKEELGLTVSIGVSYNKIFAKLGSDMKKPDAVTVISKEEYQSKVWPLDCSEMIYCGPATTKKLGSFGIHTIGDVAHLNPDLLRRWFGVNGVQLWTFANGQDTSRVMHKDFVSPIKSVGHGITCVADLESDEEVWKVMLALSQDIGHRLRLHELTAKGVQVFLRGDDLFGEQYQCKLPFTTQLPSEIAGFAYRLFQGNHDWKKQKVRAVCVRAIDLVSKNAPEQLSLFNENEKRFTRERLEDAVEEIRRRFGKQALTYCALLGNLKIPDDGRDKVRMPGMMYQ